MKDRLEIFFYCLLGSMAGLAVVATTVILVCFAIGCVMALLNGTFMESAT